MLPDALAQGGAYRAKKNTCAPWLVKHAVPLINRNHVGVDGKTAYRRFKGRNVKAKVAEFGECIWYLHVGITGKSKLDDC